MARRWPPRRASGRTPHRLRTSDLLGEALAGMLQRPGRTALTTLGIVIGITAFVAVLGVTATATGQISRRFTELTATEVTVEDISVDTSSSTRGTAFPPDADRRALAITGVRHAGVYWVVPAHQAGEVTGVVPAGAQASDQVPIVAASPGLFAAVRARMATGRPYDTVLDARADRVVVLGRVVARQLGITELTERPAIFAGGITFTVIGIVDSVQRHPELLAAAWVPRRTAERIWSPLPDPSQPPRMVIDTQLGAAAVVAKQAAVALRPDAARDFRALAPPDPRQLRDDVNTDLSGLFLALATLSLVVGAVGIANTTLVAVLERVPEIGLRRALGAQRRHIAAQFLCESTGLGAIGGLVGAGLGVTVVVLVAIGRDWTAVIDPGAVLAAPALGAVTGLISGVYPAIRASRIQPAEALRQ